MIDRFDISFQPSMDWQLVEAVTTLRFIDEKRPIVLLGQPGCAKSHLAVAWATLATLAAYRRYFTTTHDMVRRLLAAEGNVELHPRAAHRPGSHREPAGLELRDGDCDKPRTISAAATPNAPMGNRDMSGHPGHLRASGAQP
jgi:hypothetical protein